MLWCSRALRSDPFRKGSTRESGNLRSGCSSRTAFVGFPHPGDRSLISIREVDRHLNHKTGDLMEQRQNGVTADTVGACLKAPLSFSTEILITNILLILLYTSNSNTPIIILHSQSSNQIISFTSSFPFPSFSNSEFPTGLYCLVYIRPVFNVPPSRTHLRDRWFRFYIYVLASCVT